MGIFWVSISLLSVVVVLGRLLAGRGEKYGLYAIVCLIFAIADLIGWSIRRKGWGAEATGPQLIQTWLGKQRTLRLYRTIDLILLVTSIVLVWLP